MQEALVDTIEKVLNLKLGDYSVKPFVLQKGDHVHRHYLYGLGVLDCTGDLLFGVKVRDVVLGVLLKQFEVVSSDLLRHRCPIRFVSVK
jgi:hypothetical protein